jgi:cyclopropane fatty-acyl-phospholipid synthase-like methyltransferase
MNGKIYSMARRGALAAVVVVLFAFPGCTDWIKAVFYIDHMETENRTSRMHVDRIVESLELKPGETAADIGAGSGLFTRRMAERVSPGGMVYAVDINKKLLAHIEKSAGELPIRTVLAVEDDPKVPSRVDLIFICDTLHYVDQPARYIEKMAMHLDPGGRIAVIDFRKNWPPMSNRFTVDELRAWMKNAGLEPVREYDFIEDEFFIVFVKK